MCFLPVCVLVEVEEGREVLLGREGGLLLLPLLVELCRSRGSSLVRFDDAVITSS